MRKLCYLAFFIFLIIGVFGFIFPNFFEEQIMQLILELIEQTEGLGVFELIGFILSNNIKSSFIGMICGIFLGIVPVLVLIVNGYVLGFVANKTVAIEGPLVLWRLFPHGIFEIPAVMISIGMGLKLGSFIFYRKKNTEEFKELLKNCLGVFIFIVVPLLIIAAVIEGGLMVVLG